MLIQSDHDYLNEHRKVWQHKAVLRHLYREQFYELLLAKRSPGPRTLEVGSGPGFLQEIEPAILRTDLLRSPWIHCTVDVHHLPFVTGVFDNVIGLDVLHHLNQPMKVMREVTRVLRPGGRCVLVEPWITPFSRFVYTYLHQERCDLKAQPWHEEIDQFGTDKQAFDGNAAIPYLLIKHGENVLAEKVPELRLVAIEPFSLLTYILSLGFKPGSPLPESLYPFLYRLEQATRPLWVGIAALRALIVWEKAE
jgi:SAM-dependent methyltransferase